MIFSLEVLQAKHGDCLLLHFGKPANRRVMVIDGGPSGIYREFLKPRLMEIKNELSPDSPLPVSLVMVSHMDDDHVNGIVAMTDDLVNKQRNEEQVPFELRHCWFNTFDDIIGNLQIPIVSFVAASATAASLDDLPLPPGTGHEKAAVIASTGQGRRLRENAQFLSLAVNAAFAEQPGKARLVRGDGTDSVIDWEGLQIMVVHPNQQRLEAYQKKWDEDLQTAKQKGDDRIIIASLVDKDQSAFNLSSIVCLIVLEGKKILLTGDSRTDDIMYGLEANKLLDEHGRLHVDILKVPHHGSQNNASKKFYENVTADHYIISADGKHENPDQAFLNLLSDTLQSGRLYFTNKKGAHHLKIKMEAFEQQLQNQNSALEVWCRDDLSKSFVIHLADGF